MTREYIDNLCFQFLEATGAKKIDVGSKSFRSEFLDWVKSRQVMHRSYYELLDNMNLLESIDNPEAAEVGKGVLDTIARPLNTSYLTFYTKGLEKDKIIYGGLRVCDGKPLLIRHEDENISTILPYYAPTFLTQNPYTESQIHNWDQLHNSGNSNIVVGIFGSTNDKDFANKVKMLKNLRSKLEGYYQLEESSHKDVYCQVIATEGKVKRLRKTR